MVSRLVQIEHLTNFTNAAKFGNERTCQLACFKLKLILHFSEPARLDSKSGNCVRHKTFEEIDRAQHSSDHRKHLSYRNTPLRDKTGKISLHQRQGFKIRSSNVLCQPEFGSCCSPFWSIFLHSRSCCYSPTIVGGRYQSYILPFYRLNRYGHPNLGRPNYGT